MRATPWEGREYTRFIIDIVAARNAQNYLEVGVQNGAALSGISVKSAFGVDPAFQLKFDPTLGKSILRLYRMTSDVFFRDHSDDLISAGGVDFAFLDGMHLFEYLLRDVYGTERASKRSSLIALHDCMPFNGEMIERVPDPAKRTPGPYSNAWTGDVYKVVQILEKYRPDITITAVDCAPTGLIVLSDLDPSSTVIRDRYDEIIAEWNAVPNDHDAVERFYSNLKIHSADKVISNLGQSLYFRT